MKRTFQTLAGGAVLSALLGLSGASAAAAENSDVPHPLADTHWQLVEFQSMNDQVGTLKPKDATRYTMHLTGDGTTRLKLNCNTAQGQWSAESGAGSGSGRFAFGPLAATQAICPPPTMDERIARDAQYIRSYFLVEDELYLSLMADAGIYAWKRLDRQAPQAGPPLSPEEGGPRNWQVAGVSSGLNLRKQPSTTANILATLPGGTILDNLGCEAGENRDWCYVQAFGGGPVGYVAAEFLQPAVSPSGRAMTGPDDSALRAGQGNFDATGRIPCAQHRGQPMTECPFGVARAGGGYATVVITKPDTKKRAIFFRMGRPLSADTSQADGYPEFQASKEGDLHFIRLGSERYEIPDAVILGD